MAETPYLPRLDIEAMDQPTVLYKIYRMVSAQQTNLFACDGLIFPNRSREYLLQHISIAMQRGNAAAVLGTMGKPQLDSWE